MKPGSLSLRHSLCLVSSAMPRTKSPGGEPCQADRTGRWLPKPPADSYVIGPSDVLTVTVWKQPTLSGTILVRPDGMISVPLLGDVQASGMTPLQLADQIATDLKKYFRIQMSPS